MVIIDLGGNIYQLEGNINMSNDQFFKIWQKQYEKNLKVMYREFLSDHVFLDYDKYCKICFENMSHMIEHRLN